MRRTSRPGSPSDAAPEGFPPGHFYSPIPSLGELRQREDRLFGPPPPALAGIDLRRQAQLDLLSELAPFCEEQPFREGSSARRFRASNPNFGLGEAVLLQAVIRRLRSRRVVEVGAGYTTCALLDTNELYFNGSLEHTVVEPYPELLGRLLRPEDQTSIELLRTPVQDVDMAVFDALEANDVLFVDSSHVSKVGSDVNHLVFEILPRLSEGVWIHFHDIAYPFEYPREWVHEGRAWTETYLLRAFLSYNKAFAIRLFASYLAHIEFDRFSAELPQVARQPGTSLWLERVGEQPSADSTELHLAYEPDLVPPISLTRSEGIEVAEDWFRWAEEWSVLLRVYAGLGRTSDVLEIGCGLGRVAFALRYVLDRGSYCGFEIGEEKVRFLKRHFEPAHPNFRFEWADVFNGFYNPQGTVAADSYRFPYEGDRFDVVYAASVFTHMVPAAVARYIGETQRVLRAGGHALFSFFLLDHYDPSRRRPVGFDHERFQFPETPESQGFATVVPDTPDQMTAYWLSTVRDFATEAGLELVREPIPGLWSGATSRWIGAQDLVLLRKP